MKRELDTCRLSSGPPPGGWKPEDKVPNKYRKDWNQVSELFNGKDVLPDGCAQADRQTRLRQEKADLLALKDFMPKHQMRYLAECFRSRDYECEHGEALRRLRQTVEQMPLTYQNREEGALVYLHYFSGGSDWWILEKDKGDPDDEPEDAQSQAFGFVCLNSDWQCAESGYVSIAELRESRVELDFHWTPKTLEEIRAKKNPDYSEEPKPCAHNTMVATDDALGKCADCGHVFGPDRTLTPEEATALFEDKGHCKRLLKREGFIEWKCEGVEACSCGCLACITADKAAGIGREDQ